MNALVDSFEVFELWKGWDDIINNLVFSLFELVKSLIINTAEKRDWKVNAVFLLPGELIENAQTFKNFKH